MPEGSALPDNISGVIDEDLLQGFDVSICEEIKAIYPPEVLSQLRLLSLEALEGAFAAYTLVSLRKLSC